MLSLNNVDIFQLKAIIQNFHSKKSAFSDNLQRQILCLVAESNLIALRSISKNTDNNCKKGEITFKVINWFKNSSKSIQDICFDPSGSLLMVLC